VIGAAEGIAVYSTTSAPYDLVHTGGNFMSDGAGTAFSSELVLEENGPNGEFNQTVRDEASVDAIMQQFMGISNYIKMTALPFDGINHIDMHMKLLDEETLLVGEFPVGQSDGPQLEMNLEGIMADEVSVYGDPFRLVRIPMPSSTSGNYPPNASYRTFANNVFINGTVLVPTYRTEYDTIGLRILNEQLPGYRIIGIDCDSEQNIIAQSGAIHCITKTIGVRDPLLIRHQRLVDTQNSSTPYPVEAYIRHRSGIATATIFWSTAPDGPFWTVPMAPAGDGIWQGAIPAQAGGTIVYYYIHAEAISGKEQVRPIVAPNGYWSFRVTGLPTGVAESEVLRITEVFPNPASAVVSVGVDVPCCAPVKVELVDAVGRSVRVAHSGPAPADGRIFIDVADLPAAPYLVVLTSSGGRTIAPMIKH
jgi:agmatine deiminase